MAEPVEHFETTGSNGARGTEDGDPLHLSGWSWWIFDETRSDSPRRNA